MDQYDIYLTRKPTHPGAFLKEDLLDEAGLTQDQLALALGVSRRTINQIVNGRRNISAEMALRLAKYTGQSVGFWLNARTAWEVWEAHQAAREQLDKIKPLVA